MGSSDHDSRRLHDCRERHRLCRAQSPRRPARGNIRTDTGRLGTDRSVRHATLEAFTLFTGPRSTLPGCGTLYTATDWVAPGCNNVVFGPSADPVALATGFDISRDPTPGNHDAQFGVGGSYVARRNRHPVWRLLFARRLLAPDSGCRDLDEGSPALFTPNAARQSHLFRAVCSRCRQLCAELHTQIKGTTLYGEYIYKPNAPIQYNASDVLNALLSPVAPTQLRALFAAAAPGSVINAYDRLQVGNLTLGGRQVLPGVFGAKALVLGGEFGAKSVYDLPDPNSVAMAASTSSDLARFRAFPTGDAPRRPRPISVAWTAT